MASIFLSYSTTDSLIADKVEQKLIAEGHQVWRDRSRILVGQSIPAEVASGLRNCQFLAVIFTENSEQSDYVRYEIAQVLMRPGLAEDRILPLMFQKTENKRNSLLVNSSKWADFTNSFDVGMRELLARVGNATTQNAAAIADSKRRDFAIDLALRAGNVAMRFYNSCLEENRSVDDRKNAATLADKAAQTELFGKLLTHPDYKNDGLISEEMSPDDPRLEEELKKEYTWVVDPLDGTTNFQNRIPFFCTAVGVLKDRKPYIGAIFDPVANEVHFALKGERTQVWRVAFGEVSPVKISVDDQDLSKCLVGTHISSRYEIAQRMFNDGLLLKVEREVRNIRTLGSGLLALAYVASGRMQLFFQLESFLWDQVAGVVLVENAGGCVSDLRTGGSWTSATKDILATANPSLNERFLRKFGDS